MESKITYDDNFRQLKEFLGKRPGEYRIDPWYVRQGMAGKPYFWDDEKRAWKLINVGDVFYFDEDNVARQEKALEY